MTDEAITDASVRSRPVAKTRRPRRRNQFKDTWWRHLVGIVGIVVSLFPVAYVVSSAFNRDNTLQGASLIPLHVTTDNFTNLLRNNVADTSGGVSDAPYLHWILNSMIVAGATALFSTMLGALAAYAFSRFRFKGRRMGMLALLLLQMFPQSAAVAAVGRLIYTLGGVVGALGLDSRLAVIVVYL